MKEKIEKLINETLERYEFELPKDEYSAIANELAHEIVKLFAIPPVSKSVTCHHPLPYRKSTGQYTPGYTCTLCGKFIDR